MKRRRKIILTVSLIIIYIFLIVMGSTVIHFNNPNAEIIDKWKYIDEDSDFSETWFSNKIRIDNVNPFIVKMLKENIQGQIFFCNEIIGEISFINKSDEQNYQKGELVKEIVIKEKVKIVEDIFLKFFNSKLPIVWYNYIHNGEDGEITVDIYFVIKLFNDLEIKIPLKLDQDEIPINKGILDVLNNMKKNLTIGESIGLNIHILKDKGKNKLSIRYLGSILKKNLAIIKFDEEMVWGDKKEDITIIKQNISIKTSFLGYWLLNNLPKDYLVFIDKIHIGKMSIDYGKETSNLRNFIKSFKSNEKEYLCELVINNCQLDDVFAYVIQFYDNDDYEPDVLLDPIINKNLQEKFLSKIVNKFFPGFFTFSLKIGTINPDEIYSKHIDPILDEFNFYIPDESIQFSSRNSDYAKLVLLVISAIIVGYIICIILKRKN